MLAVRVAVAARLAIGLEALAIRVAVAVPVCVSSLELRRIAEERDEDDARDRHVVLERVEEEEEPAEQCEQRERKARRQSVAEQHAEPADAPDDDHPEDDARVQLAQKIPGPDHVAAPAAVPNPLEGVPDVVGGRGHAGEAQARLTLRLGKRCCVQRVGHGHDAVAAVGRGDDDAQAARDVEGHEPRRVALDRVDQARRRKARLGRVDRRGDLGIRRERHERRVSGPRQDVGELGLAKQAEAHHRRGERLPRRALGERFLDLLGRHHPAAEE